MFDSEIEFLQGFKETSLTLSIYDNNLVIDSGNVKIVRIDIYSIDEDGTTLNCIYNNIQKEYSFSDNGEYKIKILGTYNTNGITKVYLYENIFTMNNICYICYNSGSDSYHLEHPNERFHYNCMIRCSHCPLCRSNLINHNVEYSKNKNHTFVHYKKIKINYNHEFNINFKSLLKNFLKTSKYSITTNDNTIKIHFSDENNVFNMNEGFIPIILPQYYTYDSSCIIFEKMNKIISPSDKFVRGFKHLYDESYGIVYKNPQEILSSIIPTYDNFKVWIKIIFKNEFNNMIDTYILLSNDITCPAIVVKSKMNRNMIQKNIVSLCCFPKPYWTNNIIRPLLSDNIDCYKDFIKEAIV